LLVLCSGCSSLPTSGPSSFAIEKSHAADPSKAAYVLVDLTPDVLAAVGTATKPGIADLFAKRGSASSIRIGRGDLVNVTIFEAASGGLFIPTDAGSRPGNFINLPAQEVTSRGIIVVPYAGEIRAAGRTVTEVQTEIEDRLRNRAIDPQVVVSVAEQRSNRITVAGEVNDPRVIGLTAAGERVLDAIAQAGGSRYPGNETFVSLQRGGRTATVLYDTLAQESAHNVFLQPGDTVNVYRDTRSFVVLGASGQSFYGANARMRFEDETVTLAEAIARAGGISDERGDPKAVYLYRLEPKARIARLGYDPAPFVGTIVPTIYRLDLRDPGGFFLAGRLDLQDQDMLYIANAPAVEAVKLLEVFRIGVGAGRDAVALGRELRNN
jgi:polysaccharide biosynthesis/export protein